MPDSPLFTPPETAEYLRLSPRTLEKYRTRRIGPDFLRVGGSVRYRLADLDAYLNRPVPHHAPTKVDWVEFHPEGRWTRLPDAEGQACYRADGPNCYVLMAVRGAFPGQYIDYGPGTVVRVEGDTVYLPKGLYER